MQKGDKKLKEAKGRVAVLGFLGAQSKCIRPGRSGLSGTSRHRWTSPSSRVSNKGPESGQATGEEQERAESMARERRERRWGRGEQRRGEGEN